LADSGIDLFTGAQDWVEGGARVREVAGGAGHLCVPPRSSQPDQEPGEQRRASEAPAPQGKFNYKMNK